MLPPRRRTWPIVLGAVLVLVALPACLFSLAWDWEVAVPAGHETHRIAIEHGRLVLEQDTHNSPPSQSGLRFDAQFDPGFSLQYAETFTAPSYRGKRVPFAMFLAAGAIASVCFAFYRKKQPPGHCAECGYDLTNSSETCPECGTRAA